MYLQQMFMCLRRPGSRPVPATGPGLTVCVPEVLQDMEESYAEIYKLSHKVKKNREQNDANAE